MLKTLSLSLALGLCLGGGALAQTTWVEIADGVMISAFGQNADTVEDWDVVGPDGAKIGEVEEIVGTEAGTASALVVEFEDGSIFDKEREVVVPLDQFSFADNKLTLSADAAAVGAMEAYKDD